MNIETLKRDLTGNSRSWKMDGSRLVKLDDEGNELYFYDSIEESGILSFTKLTLVKDKNIVSLNWFQKYKLKGLINIMLVKLESKHRAEIQHETFKRRVEAEKRKREELAKKREAKKAMHIKERDLHKLPTESVKQRDPDYMERKLKQVINKSVSIQDLANRKSNVNHEKRVKKEKERLKRILGGLDNDVQRLDE